MEFLGKSLRLAIAIFLSLLGLGLVFGLCVWVKDYYDDQHAKPFEAVRDWNFDLKDELGLKVTARTKVIRKRLLVSIETVGYPKHLSNPRNENAQFIIEFLDQDGFKVIEKRIPLSDFTAVVGKDGEKMGMRHQFEEYIDLESYKRSSKLNVNWTLVTEAAAEMAKSLLDHCEPNLSKAERLKRLAQHGTVRETGVGGYSASGHSVGFNPVDGTLLSCK